MRHHPEAINLELDASGWADISSLIEKANEHGRQIDRELLKKVIESGTKNRFTISDDGQYIRAGYGHSIPVDLSLKSKRPPEVLYHGTAQKNRKSIQKQGLHSGKRKYVHLSANSDEAVFVGQRHGRPLVLKIDAQSMHQAGYDFYQSESEPGIWLTKKVLPEYITVS